MPSYLPVHCFYAPEYYFPVPEDHPFPMDKFWRAEAMLRTLPVGAVEICAPTPASEEDLLLVHTPDYLRQVAEGQLDSLAALKLGLPAGRPLLDRCRLEVGGTLAAAAAALRHGCAANLAGGTHHAFADRGLGYCVLNDVAIAIRLLHRADPSLRFAVVDTDAHQGNGTHGIFAADTRVFTYSIHVGRNYPAVKTPGSLDVELPRFASGALYLSELRRTLPEVFDRFRPDFVFWLSGADPHEQDRFGQLGLNDAAMAARDRTVLDHLTALGAPFVVLYSGGYNRDRIHTARLHARTIAAAAGVPRAETLFLAS